MMPLFFIPDRLLGELVEAHRNERRRTVLKAMADNANPVLRWNAYGREWVCSDQTPCFAYAWGHTREEAYRRWRRKFEAWAETQIA